MALLRINDVKPHVVTLGPAPAVGLWVQGCGRACPGCASKHTWASNGGALASTDDIAAWLAASRHSNLTISGGEPADQAPALGELLDGARRDRDWVVTCYSGYTLEELCADVRPGTAALVDRLDLLIDGPYVRELHAKLLWRGSANQRIHNLSGRVPLPAIDEAAGVTAVVGRGGSVEVIGVYPEPDMLDHLIAALGLSADPVRRSFPFPTLEEK